MKKLTLFVIAVTLFFTACLNAQDNRFRLDTKEYRFNEKDKKWYTYFQNRFGDRILLNRVIARFADRRNIEKFNFTEHGISDVIPVSKRFLDGFYVLEISPNGDPFLVAQHLFNTGMFDVLEFDALGKQASTPNDNKYQDQWNLDSTKLDMEKAWDINTGDPSITVAVIDGGVTYNHGDIDNNIWVNSGEDDGDGIPEFFSTASGGDIDGVDDDDNGYVDDLIGWDCYNDDNLPSGDEVHGSGAAGIIAAETNNTIGVSGIAGGWAGNDGVKLMVVGDVNWIPKPVVSAMAMAIEYAVDNGAYVLSISQTFIDTSSTLQSAVSYAAANNVVVVCAAGNHGGDNSDDPVMRYPARYFKTISVGATTQDDERWNTSSKDGSAIGTTESPLDVVAPGAPSSIWTISNVQSSYRTMGKTSAATPHVAGLAALIKSINSNLSWLTIRGILHSSTDKVSEMNGSDITFEHGHGRVNAYKALKYTIENHGGTLGGINETIRFREDIEISNGVTLTIASGTTVEFDPGTKLTINGTLDAQGTSSNPITFKRNGGSGTWDGIYISGSSASSSELVNCTIKEALIGINVSNSDPLIEKCYVHSCSSYPLKLTSGATPKVLNNKFYAGSTHAVYISSAGGDFGANEFRTSSGTTYGVYITGSTANPNFDNKWGDGGNLFDLANISSHGAYAAGGYPEFGSHGAREGENDFINRGSSNYIYNNTGSTIDAEYNYWDGTPQSSWFGGSIDYNPYESSSNGAGPGWKVMVSPFQPGLTKYEEGNYTEALTELKLALEQNTESDDAVGAVFKMAMSAFKTGVLDEQETFLIGLSKSINPEVQYMSRVWLAYLYFQQKKLDQAEKTALLAPVGSLAERSELLALVSYYSTLGDADAAIRIAEILQSHHKDDYLAFDLGEAAHTKLVFQDNLSKTGAKKNPDYHFSTYPNPFNPSTTMQFNLSTDDHITLQIFDMLGRHVQTLINRDMPAGFHSVKWNGRNSKGKEAAAGIYLARLRTGETIRSIKLSLIR